MGSFQEMRSHPIGPKVFWAVSDAVAEQADARGRLGYGWLSFRHKHPTKQSGRPAPRRYARNAESIDTRVRLSDHQGLDGKLKSQRLDDGRHDGERRVASRGKGSIKRVPRDGGYVAGAGDIADGRDDEGGVTIGKRLVKVGRNTMAIDKNLSEVEGFGFRRHAERPLQVRSLWR